MFKIAIFAHFDKNNIIQDYVVYYLQELKKIAETIVFVSDSNLSDVELNKIKNITNITIAKRHGEYDFGSYKRGYKYLIENNLINNSIEELIFANDSCIGPLYPFNKIWNKMSNRENDFWGISLNKDYKIKHIQSFFLVFKPQVFNSQVFKDFMNNITKLETKDEIIKQYEIGLSEILTKNNFKMDAIIDYQLGEKITGDMLFSKELPPLIKTSAVRSLYNFNLRMLFNYYNKKFGSSYPSSILTRYSSKYKKSFTKNLKAVRRLFFSYHSSDKKLCILGHWFKL